LHQHGIDARLGEPHDMLLDGVKLGRKHKRIQRHVAAHAALVQKRHDLGKGIEMQVRRPRPGIEAAFEPEVHRVRPIFHGSRHAQPVARRGQQLQWAIAACSVLRMLEVVIDHEWTGSGACKTEAAATQQKLILP
jgi:hypothetical protein